jgi:hypothetical protein
VVELLVCKHKALSSNPSPIKKKKKKASSVFVMMNGGFKDCVVIKYVQNLLKYLPNTIQDMTKNKIKLVKKMRKILE